MTDRPVGWSFLYSRRWIGYFALFLTFAVACVFLGNWQFDRRAEARSEIDRIDRNYDAAPVALEEALPNPKAFDVDADKWLTVTTTGHYEDGTVLARNRPGPGGVGANIIAPFRTSGGDVLFVDRGWIPADSGTLEESLQTLPATPSGEVTLVARLRASEPAIDGRSASGMTVASIDLPAIAELAEVSGEAYTGAYGMLVSETPAGEHGQLPSKPERDEGPHLSYALQWYVFILIAGIGTAYAARQEYKGLNAGSEVLAEQQERQAARKAAREKKRGLSDADEEDALLDA